MKLSTTLWYCRKRGGVVRSLSFAAIAVRTRPYLLFELQCCCLYDSSASCRSGSQAFSDDLFVRLQLHQNVTAGIALPAALLSTGQHIVCLVWTGGKSSILEPLGIRYAVAVALLRLPPGYPLMFCARAEHLPLPCWAHFRVQICRALGVFSVEDRRERWSLW